MLRKRWQKLLLDKIVEIVGNEKKAIAESRILEYDGNYVTFKYKRHEDDKIIILKNPENMLNILDNNSCILSPLKEKNLREKIKELLSENAVTKLEHKFQRQNHLNNRGSVCPFAKIIVRSTYFCLLRRNRI